MDSPAPIQIKNSTFTLPKLKNKPSINKILKNWLSSRNSYFINNKSFSEYYYSYKINKANSYTNTRTTRFQKFIKTELLGQLTTHIDKTNCNQLLNLIHQVVNTDSWLAIIENRLGARNYKIDGLSERQVYFKYLPDRKIELKQIFTFIGTATWINTQWDEDDLQDPPTIDIATSKSKLFSGESTFIFEEDSNNQIQVQTKNAKATLFATAMRPAFIEPTLDELINALLPTLEKNQHKILSAAKEYYLAKLSSQELQNIFISTKFYTEQFKNSESYKLIKKIIEEKPIPGFHL